MHSIITIILWSFSRLFTSSEELCWLIHTSHQCTNRSGKKRAVGRTGKTPTVIASIDALQDAIFTPSVVSQSYGAHIIQHTEVNPTSAPALTG
ncbi:tetraacyldisaccharide 4'-kinase [Candidatus Vallotia lariciata]|uniref:tetraacyldisaccharide 4'-kinase n=1 Tax=Candidatus Vallotia laricis TaxID=2018052 RepID=UPI001D02F0A1